MHVDDPRPTHDDRKGGGCLAVLLVVVMTLLISVVSCATSDTPAATQERRDATQQQRPNVVTIMVDDARLDDLAVMPKTRRLVGAARNKGARWVNSYSTLPLCCPSRATFLTGQYPHNHGVWANKGPHGGWDKLKQQRHNLLPVWLRNAGYNTVALGKFLNGYPDYPNDGNRYVPPGWAHWSMLSGRGDYNYRRFTVTTNGRIEHHENQYQTKVFKRKALRQLNKYAPRDKPMFMWLSLLAPHQRLPYNGTYVTAEKKYEGVSNPGVPNSKAFNEKHVADKPPWVERRNRLTADDIGDIKQHRAERRDAMRTVDDTVAAVIRRLRHHGELHNTLIIFTSDNGYMFGEHRIKFGKTFPYEESARVPLLMRGPGVDPGRWFARTSNVDLARTVMDAANAPAGRPLDGVSLLGPIHNITRRPLLLESPGHRNWLPAYAGLRVPGFSYIEYGDDAGRELYDMGRDPDQQRNRIGNPDYNWVKRDLADKLAQVRDCIGVSCRTVGPS